MLAIRPKDDDPGVRELAADYCDALLNATPEHLPRHVFQHALKLTLVAIAQEAIADGTESAEEAASFYEGVAARIRLTSL